MPLFLNDKLLHNAIASAVRKYGKNGLVDEIEKLKARILELENRQNPNVYHPSISMDTVTKMIEDVPRVNEVHVATPQTIDAGIKEIDKIVVGVQEPPKRGRPKKATK